MIPHDGGADRERSMWMLFAQYPFWEVQGTRPISLTGGAKTQNQPGNKNQRDE